MRPLSWASFLLLSLFTLLDLHQPSLQPLPSSFISAPMPIVPLSDEMVGPPMCLMWGYFFSFMMSVELHTVSLIQPDINQIDSPMEAHMQRDYIRTQTQHTNKSSQENLLMLLVGDLLLEVGSFFYQRLFCILIICFS